jgi:isopentenyl-diphosphate delta-isomerase
LPLIINAITGGIEEALALNRDISELGVRFNIGIAVGSQTIALENKQLAQSFKIVRKVNRDGLILANVAANTEPCMAVRAIEMIEANGLQLHLNVPQELAMKEGDRNFRGLQDNIAEIVRLSPVPVIAKEVGFGLSRETAQQLFEAGVRFFDVGGRGGTNFIAIEQARSGVLADEFASWGIPTAVSIAELASLYLPIVIVASGGIRGGLEAAKALALGANLVGIAGRFLKIWSDKGVTALEDEIRLFEYHLKAAMMMTGAKDLADLRRKPLVIGGTTTQWLTARGIDVNRWARRSEDQR